MNKKEHWENIYATKQADEVSWFQVYPKTSMEFVRLFKLGKDAKIIDIGGGDSHFVDSLIEEGFTNITVLDISANAIARAKKRLGEKAKLVHWIVSDVTEFVPAEHYDFWHDRAAFHFLLSEELADKYVEIAKKGIAPNGFLVLGTFSESGPEKCSGLKIHQYSEQSMSRKFENGFKRIKCISEDHLTPFNTTQNFLFCSFQREPA
ncbi:MAG TPA: class I SAM-dependent methyltransferase [Bacteroidia bacterium]|nr:class I SAM-dependent methyltransferase [Bacteroidia bacterium]